MTYHPKYNWFMRKVAARVLGYDNFGWPHTDRIFPYLMLFLIAVGVWVR